MKPNMRDVAEEKAANGDLLGALVAFKQAIACEPNDSSLHEAVAQIQSELDEHGDALVSAAKAVELNLKWADARVTLAHASRNCGLLDQAAEQLNVAMTLMGLESPDRDEVQAELEEVMELQGRALVLEIGLPQLELAQAKPGDLLTMTGGESDLQSAGPSVKVWEAGVVLAALLVCNPEISAVLPGASVLELGSGTGITGITAALLGARVALTDLPEALPALQANLDRNRSAIHAAGGDAAVYAWDWQDALGGSDKGEASAELLAGCSRFPVLVAGSEGSAAASEFKLVIGADLVYSPQQAAPLAAALRVASEAHPGATVLLAHKHRSDAVDVALLQSLAKAGFKAKRECTSSKQTQHEHEHAAAGPTVHSEAGDGSLHLVGMCLSASHADPGHAGCQGVHSTDESSNADRFIKLLGKFPAVSVYRLTR